MSRKPPTVREEWGMACPKCKSDENLRIEVMMTVQLYHDGTQIIDGDHEWGRSSPCRCAECDWEGTVADAQDYTPLETEGE